MIQWVQRSVHELFGRRHFQGQAMKRCAIGIALALGGYQHIYIYLQYTYACLNASCLYRCDACVHMCAYISVTHDMCACVCVMLLCSREYIDLHESQFVFIRGKSSILKHRPIVDTCANKAISQWRNSPPEMANRLSPIC